MQDGTVTPAQIELAGFSSLDVAMTGHSAHGGKANAICGYAGMT
jgi:hypothetical protein